MFSGEASKATAGPSAEPTDVDCPAVTIRAGASTLSVTANAREESAMDLRYQVSFGQMARECRLASNTVTMRVGVQGRVILGPAGGPGQVDVPIRFAVVREGPEPRPIATKFQKVNVAIPADNNGNVLFTHIEEDISFPLPRGGDLDNYVVYVGFDPLGAAREQPRRQQRQTPRQAPRQRS